MADLDTVVRRIADAVLSQVSRLSRYVTRLAVAAIAVTAIAGVLGVMALDGGILTVWIVVAVVLGWISISRVVRLRWNLARLTTNRNSLETELIQAMNQQPDADEIIIEMRDVDVSDELAMEIWTDRFASARFDRSNLADYRWVSLAVQSLKQLGIVLVTTTFITAFFALMALVYLLALALS